MKRLFFIVILALCVASRHANANPAGDCANVLTDGVPSLAGSTSFCAGHAGYFVLIDTKALIPRIVVERLEAAHTLGCFQRKNNFHAEPDVPSAKPSDYLKSGYDLGHQAPAEDFAWNEDQMSDSFSTVNMAPQLGDLNRQGWERLEDNVRSWALARGVLDVYTGPILGGKKTIGKDNIVVPTAFFKVIYDPKTGDSLAFIYPQAAVAKTVPLERFLTTVKDVEEQSGVTLPVPKSSSDDKVWSDVRAAWRAKHVCKK
jgi:endonuclease G, mitochondrial